MSSLMLELPMDALLLPGASTQSLAAEASFLLALKLFEVGRSSSVSVRPNWYSPDGSS